MLKDTRRNEDAKHLDNVAPYNKPNVKYLSNAVNIKFTINFHFVIRIEQSDIVAQRKRERETHTSTEAYGYDHNISQKFQRIQSLVYTFAIVLTTCTYMLKWPSPHGQSYFNISALIVPSALKQAHAQCAYNAQCI